VLCFYKKPGEDNGVHLNYSNGGMPRPNGMHQANAHNRPKI
jgi:hypothetical protein